MNITEKNYLENGYTGLCNLGNTCFLNSCVQILVHTLELHKIFNNPAVVAKLETNKKMDEALIMTEWKTLTELMWSGNGAVKPLKFVTIIHEVAQRKDIEIFTGWAQNDVTEFLRFIVNCFHTSIARSVKVNIKGKAKTNIDSMALKCCDMLSAIYSKEYSEIYDMFYGICMTELKTPGGEICSQKPEHYFIIDLPIPTENPKITLYDCLDLFIKEELLTGDNKWFNEKTGLKEDVNKRNYFWNFPNILIITLKRFSVNHNRISRINEHIDCPLSGFDLSKYVEGYDAKKYVYDLYGVSNHMGGPMGGHYTSYVKTIKDWIHYNDDRVEKISSETVISPMTYCLFYKIRE
jgi:ubiquitin C-terminal hydrolase